ncbi:MAG: glycosyltransferase [Bacteroidota bacterium]|nr:glycosyltransferase [Bacteroidota bacterium]
MSEQHILLIGTVWPEPGSSAAGSRTLQLIELFKAHNWEVTFACAAAESEFMIDLESYGVKKVNIQLNNSSFDAFIRNLKPDIVLFDRFMIEEQFGWRVAENWPDALRVLDTIDLHCLRLARQAALKEKRSFTADDLYNETAKREIASIYRCDCSIMISMFEMNVLQDHFKIPVPLLHYTPFLLEPLTEKDMLSWPSFRDRSHFITIGNFLHEPNWNGVLFLKEEIWPLIRKQLPQAQMHVYGAYASQKVNQLHNAKDGFLIKGRAPNAKEVMLQSRVCLAPLRFGAGLKGKLIDAMECGTPSVTSSIGAEGMHGSFDWPGVITDTVSEFVEGSVKLFTSEDEWNKASRLSEQIINGMFAKDLHSGDLIEKLLNLKVNLVMHRRANFTGAMLTHHTISGTKYMSRWIEEKNKKPL